MPHPRGPALSYRSHAFGLNLELSRPVAGCPPRPWVSGQPALQMGPVGNERTETGVQDGIAVTEAGGGYRLEWEGVGSFTLAGDGSLECTRDPREDGRWERFVVAQALPLAAVMAGLEVLHASCVVLGGAAVGLVGPSGAGKSTLAGLLVRGGARFMADDVLALSPSGGRPTAHPGASLVRLAPDDDGAPVDSGGKVAREMPQADGACGLGLLYFLNRSDTATELSVEPGVGVKELMGATFNLLVQSPVRLTRQLELMARVDEGGVPLRVRIPARMPAEQTAAALATDALARLSR